MYSPQKKIILLLTGLFALLGLISLSCNLPAGLQERIFGLAATPTQTVQPTNTPQPLPPVIVEADPPSGSTVALEGSITLYFNQAMDQKSVEGGLSTYPELEGSFLWVDSSTLQFKPDQPLPPGSEIQLILDTTALAANGLSLPQEQILSFYTADFLRAVTILPSPGSAEIDPQAAILVSFNQPAASLGDSQAPAALVIDPAPPGQGEWINSSTYQFSPQPGLAGGATYQVAIAPDLVSTAGTALEAGSTLSWTFSTSYPQVLDWEPHDGDAGVLLDRPIRLVFNQAMDPDSLASNFTLREAGGGAVAGTFQWSEDFQQVEFVPDQLLSRGANYAAVLPGEVISAGGTPLGLDTSLAFQTTGDFQFLGTPGGQNYSTSIYEGATLYFNNPVDPESIEGNITLIPEIGDFWPSIGGNGNVLNIYGDFAPLTDYTLVLAEPLADIWGSELGTARSVKFTTQALPPNLTVTQGNSVLFLTGSENAIPARATNLYQVSLNIGSIPPQDIPMFFGPGLYTNLEDYYPQDALRWTEILDVPGDEIYTANLPVSSMGKALPPGLYRYQIYSQELPYNPAPYLLSVSNLHLTMKTSPENLLIWALDLQTGEAVSGAEITVYDHGGEAIFSGETNQDGIFQAEFAQPVDQYDQVFYAVSGDPGEDDFGITASSWSFGTEAYNFGLASNYGSPQPQTYIYTDRPIYRPGQTVHFRLIHRDREGGGYTLPDAESIELTIFRSGEEQEIVSLPLSAYGTAEGEFQLSSFAEPGYCRLETEHGMALFQVAEYRKPEIDLEASFGREEALIGEAWEGSVAGRYYFDAPAAEVGLEWYLRAEPTRFDLPGYQVGELDSNWFAYPGPDYPGIWGTRIAEGEGETDQEGSWAVGGILGRIDLYDREVSLPANFILSVTARDETGFEVTSQARMVVHPSDFYLGVQPSAWMVESGEPVDFEILAVDWNRQPDGIHQLRAEFHRVVWNYQVGEIGQIEYSRELEQVSGQDLTTGRDGQAQIRFSPQEPGTYQVDIFGEGARTEVMLWVGGPGTATWPTQVNQKLNLVLDRDSYQPGDEARVFIPNPFPEGAQALVTLERHKVISYQRLSIAGSGELIAIPLGEDDAPNIYLSVTLIGRETTGELNFRQGYANLLVEPSEKLLQIEVIGEPERLKPGEEVAFTVRISDQDGNPQVGEFSLAVVDKAVLALSDPFAPSIVDAFYGVQPLAVKMGLPLGMHAGRMVFVPGGMGGGEGDLEDAIRENFEDTGYWQADLVTDEKGEAEVRFILPDNLTTWQAEARGVTLDTSVGQSSAEIITSKDLLVRPVTPRFLVAGDHLALAAIVHNNTGEDLTVDVSLLGSGLALDYPENATQTVDVPAGGRTRVEWWGSAAEADQADLLFTAEAEGYSDAVKPYLGPLPILRYLAPASYGTSGLLEEAGQELEIVSLPRSYHPAAGSLEIELAPSLAASILTALEALEERELYSNEGIVSYFLPNVVTYQTLKALELEHPQLESRLETLISDTLDALAAAQNEDGGWGWWAGGASDPEISSYILFGLTQAQEAGVFVDELMIQRSTGYLMATLPAVNMLSESWQYNQQAMRYFALTEAGMDVTAGMEALAGLESQLDPGYRALLAVALESGRPGNDRTRSLLSNLAGLGIRSATGLHWDNQPGSRSWLTSPTTGTAMAVYALARIEDSPDVLPEALRYLVSMKSWQGDWWSPYETSWTVLALNEALQASGELASAYQYSASVNGRELISGYAEGPLQLAAAQASLPVRDLFAEEPNALVVSRSEGNGTLYYQAHLLVFRPAEDVQPFGRGLSISRVYTKLTGGTPQFVQSASVGDLIQVDLTLVVESDTNYLLIEDFIPAGAEILDTRLKTTRQDLDDYLISAPFRDGWGWWYFNPPRIYDGRITWTAKSLPAGTYQLTYLLSLAHPGEFQVLPAHARGIYFPETMAVSAGDRFVIEGDR